MRTFLGTWLDYSGDGGPAHTDNHVARVLRVKAEQSPREESNA